MVWAANRAAATCQGAKCCHFSSFHHHHFLLLLADEHPVTPADIIYQLIAIVW